MENIADPSSMSTGAVLLFAQDFGNSSGWISLNGVLHVMADNSFMTFYQVDPGTKIRVDLRR